MQAPRLPYAIAACAALLLCLSGLAHAHAERSLAAERGWVQIRRAPADQRVSLTFSLKHSRDALDALNRRFHEVSDPNHDNYQNFLSREELSTMMSPGREAIDAVKAHLHTFGAKQIELTGSEDVIKCEMTVEAVERLLERPLFHYQHPHARHHIVRAEKAVAVPHALRDLVHIISGVSGFPHVKVPRQVAAMESQRASMSSGSGTPILYTVYASERILFPLLQITCLNSNYTNSVTSPCSDFPPAVKGFIVHLSDGLTGATTNATVGLGDAVCSAGDNTTQCALHLNETVVNTPSFRLLAYGRYGVSIQTLFADGTASPPNDFYDVNVLTSDFITPQLLSNLYNVPIGMSGNLTTNAQSVAEFGGQYFSPADLAQFFERTGIRSIVPTVVGPNNASEPGDEAQLDIQWITALAQDVKTVFWSMPGEEYLLEWGAQVLGTASPPFVHSISYSDNEADCDSLYGIGFIDRCDIIFQQMANRGLTVVVAAGDAGASNVGHGTTSCSPFAPQYPASSPYVLTVGATVYTTASDPLCNTDLFYGVPAQCPSTIREAAVSISQGTVWTTGGGFSSIEPMPLWQKAAAARYFKTSGQKFPPSSWFNSSGRVYPDISAIGHNLIVYTDGEMTLADGTSASTPIVASIISMLNAVSIKVTTKPLGFVNDLFYQLAVTTPAAFNDITVGDNLCGDVLHPPHVTCCAYGYYAGVGFDPVSGLGSPNFQFMASTLDDFFAARAARLADAKNN